MIIYRASLCRFGESISGRGRVGGGFFQEKSDKSRLFSYITIGVAQLVRTYCMRPTSPFTPVFFVAVLFLGLHLTSCKPDDQVAGNGGLAIRLTDQPASFDSVLIDLAQVRVRTTLTRGFVDLPTYAGKYDLLRLQNGLDTLIALGSLPAGDVEEIRLVLGPNNYVVVSGIPVELKTPSAEASGLKIKLQQVMVQDSLTTVLLDFDAEQSIVDQGNGGFLLKPVIKVVN